MIEEKITDQNKLNTSQLNNNQIKFEEIKSIKFNKFIWNWKKYPITQKMAVILFWLMSPVLLFFMPYNIIMELGVRENPAALFFGVFDRFTFLSNYISCFVLLLFSINPKHFWFRGNRLILANASYMLFTFIGYNTILYEGYQFNVDEIINANAIESNTNLYFAVNGLIQNIYTHALNPVVAVCFFFFVVWKGKYLITKSVVKETIITMIFPTAYALYLIAVPYTNWQTNDRYEYVVINPTPEQIANGEVEPYSVYGNPTNTKENPLAWAYIIGFYTAVIGWTFGLYYAMNFIYSKINKKALIIKKNKK